MSDPETGAPLPGAQEPPERSNERSDERPDERPEGPPVDPKVELDARLAAFHARLAGQAKKSPSRRARFRTSAEIELADLYTPLQAPSSQLASGRGGYLDDLSLPGEPPFTRGVQPTMYRGRLWTMRQYAGFGSAAESNARYRFLLSRGQT